MPDTVLYDFSDYAYGLEARLLISLRKGECEGECFSCSGYVCRIVRGFVSYLSCPILSCSAKWLKVASKSSQEIKKPGSRADVVLVKVPVRLQIYIRTCLCPPPTCQPLILFLLLFLLLPLFWFWFLVLGSMNIPQATPFAFVRPFARSADTTC